MIIPMFTAFRSVQKDGGTKEESTTKNKETVSLYLEESQSVVTLSVKDYLTGVLFAEMNCEYEPEALKAQAVASYTYYLYTKESHLNKPDTSLMGAYISDSPAVHQAYIKSDDAKKKFGDNYKNYYNKISKAVDSVLGEYMEYDGKPILAVFHSYNRGQTEDAEIIWGKPYNYLKSVDSKGDKLSPNVSSTVVLPKEKFKECLKDCKGVSLDENPENWITDTKVSNAGTVTHITIGGVTITGMQARSLFSLKSANFIVQYDAKKGFVFTVLGYGHGVGMSQYGADYMARQGAGYKEILNHYYTGVTIKKK